MDLDLLELLKVGTTPALVVIWFQVRALSARVERLEARLFPPSQPPAPLTAVSSVGIVSSTDGQPKG